MNFDMRIEMAPWPERRFISIPSNGRVRLCLASLVILILLGIPPCSFARQTQADSGGIAVTYPNSADGLKRQIDDTLAAFETKKKRNIRLAVKDLMLADYISWFRNAFGELTGQKLAKYYKSDYRRLEDSLTDQLRYSVSEGRTTVGTKLIGPTSAQKDTLVGVLFSSLKSSQVFYEILLSKQGSEPNNFTGPFFYDQGKFHTLPWEVFMRLPGAPPGRIRVGPDVVESSLVHRVNPIPPPEAVKNHLSGTVVLHVIIARDGSVKDVQVVQGDQVLTEAAVDAVKQWRYKPILLNGQSVEVDTTIHLIFNLK